MTPKLAGIIGALALGAGLLLLIFLIVKWIWNKGKEMSRLRISEKAYRDRDKIEEKTDKARRDIDRDLPDRIAAARERVSGETQHLADQIAKVHDGEDT